MSLNLDWRPFQPLRLGSLQLREAISDYLDRIALLPIMWLQQFLKP